MGYGHVYIFGHQGDCQTKNFCTNVTPHKSWVTCECTYLFLLLHFWYQQSQVCCL